MIIARSSVVNKLRSEFRWSMTGGAILSLFFMCGCDPCMNMRCDDGDACNGMETCSVDGGQAVCSDGVPVECDPDQTCTEPDGACVGADPCADVTCLDGESCVDGTCVADEPTDACADVTCPDGESCVDGACVADEPTDLCADVTCPDGESCLDGACVADAPTDPCADVTCPDGESCVDGSCVADAPVGGDAAAGEAFFDANGCAGCHGADATGGVGPNIVGQDAAEILERLTVVGAHVIGPNLPDTTQQDADDIAAFLGSL